MEDDPMAMKPTVSTLLREEALDLCRTIQHDATNGNAYAAGLLPAAKDVARKAVTVDEGIQGARSLLLDPYSGAAQERVGLIYDRAALRREDIVVSVRPG